MLKDRSNENAITTKDVDRNADQKDTVEAGAGALVEALVLEAVEIIPEVEAPTADQDPTLHPQKDLIEINDES